MESSGAKLCVPRVVSVVNHVSSGRHWREQALVSMCVAHLQIDHSKDFHMDILQFSARVKSSLGILLEKDVILREIFMNSSSVKANSDSICLKENNWQIITCNGAIDFPST